MSRSKVTKDTIPNDFTMGLAIVDAIPVILFCMSMIIVSGKLSSPLFLIGSLLMLIAGICKVIWKIIVVLQKKNIWLLFIQMRIMMPIGLFLAIISVFLKRFEIDMSLLLSSITTFPSALFFSLGLLGMLLMIVFGFTLDGSKLKNNWIEQITNAMSQLFILLGILMM